MEYMIKATEKLSASLEDYLEAILLLCSQEESARSKDIAEKLAVAKPSVTGALRLLKKKGLVNYKPYGAITLTEQGRKAAINVARKHETIKTFFINILGVNPDTAQAAACRAEHAFGAEIISGLRDIIEFASKKSNGDTPIIEQFRQFRRSRQQGTQNQNVR